MFQKVHLQLTLLFTGVTSAIMIIMSLIYLYVSETNLYDTQFQSFKNDINTITANLEENAVISMEWLSKMETQGNYLFFVKDNGISFLYNDLQDTNDISYRKNLYAEGMQAYHSQFPDREPKENLSPFLSFHEEFIFSSSSRDACFGSYIVNEKNNSSLQILILSPINKLQAQIMQQRIHFLIINLTTVFCLFLFSRFFTGRLLKPIAENQQKQAAFIASASHELRTPLSVILSCTECLRKSPVEKSPDFLKIIQQEGLRMSLLINDMLSLSQSDNRHLALCCQRTELDTLVINSYEAFLPLAGEKNLSLFLSLPDDSLPSCFCDSERISQVIAILLHNAISYTPAKGNIVLSLFYEKKHFFISVADTGIGISNEDKAKIFDRFYRAEKSRSTKGHFGLGLSIAYEIIKLHHGTIKVADNPNGGCIFTVMLLEAF